MHFGGLLIVKNCTHCPYRQFFAFTDESRARHAPSCPFGKICVFGPKPSSTTPFRRINPIRRVSVAYHTANEKHQFYRVRSSAGTNRVWEARARWRSTNPEINQTAAAARGRSKPLLWLKLETEHYHAADARKLLYLLNCIIQYDPGCAHDTQSFVLHYWMCGVFLKK